MNMRERRMTPDPEVSRAARKALRAKLLDELGKHNRTTQQLATILKVEQQSLQYPLRVLETEGKITGFTDRRNSARGALSKVWAINGEKKIAEPLKPRDPMLWALYGSPP
jgi:DNA-binding transcriptional ArsR family regulator